MPGKTNFEKVQEFNRAFDMAPKEPATYLAGEIDKYGRTEINPFLHGRAELITQQPKLIRLRLDLIKEELGEFFEPMFNKAFFESARSLNMSF